LLLSVPRHDHDDLDNQQRRRTAEVLHKSGSLGDLILDDKSATSVGEASVSDCDGQLQGSVSSHQTATTTTSHELHASQNKSHETQYQSREGQWTATDSRQRSGNCDELTCSRSSVGRSKPSSSAAAAAAAASAKSDSESLSSSGHKSRKDTAQRHLSSRPSRPLMTHDVQSSTRTACGRSTTPRLFNNTSQSSRTNNLTSISSDSEKLLNEFEAINKLKLFAGLGRHGRKLAGAKSQRTDDGRRVDDETCVAGRSHTNNSPIGPSASAVDGLSTNNSRTRRPSAGGQVQSARPGNVIMSTLGRTYRPSGVKARKPASSKSS